MKCNSILFEKNGSGAISYKGPDNFFANTKDMYSEIVCCDLGKKLYIHLENLFNDVDKRFHPKTIFEKADLAQSYIEQTIDTKLGGVPIKNNGWIKYLNDYITTPNSLIEVYFN